MNYLYADVDIVRIARTSGGVVGYTDINATSQPSVNYNFWEKDIAPGEELNSVGSVVNGTTSISFDYKDPSEMKIRNTYTDWDFVNVWMIKERVDSPSLIWEGKK